MHPSPFPKKSTEPAFLSLKCLARRNPPEQKKRGKSLDYADTTTQGCSEMEITKNENP
jgi:hypothetical protein